MTQETSESSSNTEQNSNSEQEKLIPQSQVNSIVKDRTERLKNQYNDRIENLEQTFKTYLEKNSNNPMIDQNEIKKLVQEESKNILDQHLKMQQEAVITQQVETIAREFQSKVQANKNKYEDYDKVVGNFYQDLEATDQTGQKFTGPSTIFDIIELANRFEDPAQILYHFANNPHKIGLVRQAASLGQANGLKAMKKIVDSLKQSDTTSKQANSPLGQVKSSYNRDNGNTNKSVQDMLRQLARKA